MKKESGFELLVAGIIAFCVLLPLGMLLRAWMLTKLWVMFIVPQFELNTLSYSAALGISLIIGILTKQDLSKLQKTPDEGLWSTVFSSLLKIIIEPVFTVGMAYVIIWIFE